MAATPPFKYYEQFPVGIDETEYYLLTNKHISVGSFEGKEMLTVMPEAITELTRAALRDCSFMLRTNHLKQLGDILNDPGLPY